MLDAIKLYRLPAPMAMPLSSRPGAQFQLQKVSALPPQYRLRMDADRPVGQGESAVPIQCRMGNAGAGVFQWESTPVEKERSAIRANLRPDILAPDLQLSGHFLFMARFQAAGLPGKPDRSSIDRRAPAQGRRPFRKRLAISLLAAVWLKGQSGCGSQKGRT